MLLCLQLSTITKGTMAESIEAQATSKGPVCLIVLGMAGSGKTTLVQRLSTMPNKPYVVNLDPACVQMPYFANIGEICNRIFNLCM